jgi:manganese/iron transport system permease protein/iron/zinc/copper transport system permease protein
MAAAIGMPVVLLDYLLTTCVSLVVVSAVSMVGVILVVGLLITPAATAYLLSDRLERMMMLAALFGVTGVLGGLYLCVWFDSSGGGAIMLFATLQFVTVLIVAPRYGLLARWRQRHMMVPQQITEDILGTLVRQEGLTPSEIEARVATPGKIGRAVRNLISQGLLATENGGVKLTENGRTEANRILRAHRLWETYLQHVGTPEAEIHPKAEALEHMHDEKVVGYLDDLLGHPATDPDGKVIPEDIRCLAPGNLVPLSCLREGRSGIVADVSPPAEAAGLVRGDRIRIGPRRGEGKIWTVVRGDDAEIRLDHADADGVLIRCD